MMNLQWARVIRWLSAGMASVACFGAAVGCSGSVSVGDGSGGNNDNDNDPDTVDEDMLRVQFYNALTNSDVDTEFYYANEELSDPEEDLFVPANRRQVGIGAAGTGILLAQDLDSIDIPCSEDLVLGTSGGSFKDPDTGETLGVGNQRLIEVGFILDCGDTVTIVYYLEDDEFATDIDL